MKIENGQMTVEQIWKEVKKELEKIKRIDPPVQFTKELTKFLKTMHPSDAYVVIRDYINPKKNSKISKCKEDDVTSYQEFQELWYSCRDSYNHDNSMATNLDVDKAVSKAYGIAMRAIRATIDMNKDELNKVHTTINKIEEHLGLGVTNFNEEDEVDSNDTGKSIDVQRDKNITDGTGKSSKAE